MTSTASTSLPPHARAGPAVFPLGLCIATTVCAGLGLVAAAVGAQWGADSPSGDALALAWPYVNLSVVAAVLLVWPAVALNKARGHAWDVPAIILAVTPALALAGLCTGVSWPEVMRIAALHASFIVFELGLLSVQSRHPSLPAAIAALDVLLVLALPLLSYLDREILGRASAAWEIISPSLAVTAAHFSWWTPIGYALVGGSLLALAPRPK